MFECKITTNFLGAEISKGKKGRRVQLVCKKLHLVDF